MRKRRRIQLILLLILAGIVVSLHFLVDVWTREPPNYDEIEPNLYLGGFMESPPPGTTVVLNLCEMEDHYRCEVHRWRPIPDAAPAPSLDWLREQVEFVEQQISAGRIVYVHCRNGVSRSGMVVIAYLMKQHRWKYEDALEFVRARREKVRPNPAFRDLLRDWETASEITSRTISP
jgi:protein-tyrosine phosphatase